MITFRPTHRRRLIVAVASAVGVSVVGAVVALPGAQADPGRSLHLTNAFDSVVAVGGPPPAQRVGGSFFVDSHVVSGGVGRTSASCVVTSTLGAGVRQCEVDLKLHDGIITTRGLTDLANTAVTLVVTGGTGRYASARGHGTLTPTRTGSVVDLRLR